MAQASTARRRIIYGVEANFGVTPADGTIMRNTGDSLNLTKNTIQSAELSGDRAIRFLRHGNEAVGGDISFELAYNDFDVFLAAALGSTWGAETANVLKQGNGTSTRPVVIPTFSIEKGFQDIVQYIVYTGCAINTLTIDMATDSVVTGSIGIVGAGTSGFTNTSFDAAPTDPFATVRTEPFVNYDGTVTLAGGSGCVITALSLSIDNGITANYALCSAEAQSVTPDRVNVTGTATILFENATEVNKFISETTSSLSVTLEDPAGNRLIIALPKIKYTGGDIPVSGGGVVSISLPFQALYDDTAGVLTSITITRTPAA